MLMYKVKEREKCKKNNWTKDKHIVNIRYIIYSHDEANKMNRRNGVLQGIKASLSVVNTSSQGLCKALARLHYPYLNLLLKGPARFAWLNLICPCFVCVTLQGKASARLQSLCSNLFLKGSARLQQGSLPFVQEFLSKAMQGKASTSAPLHHSLNQTRYWKPTDMHSPPPNITT